MEREFTEWTNSWWDDANNPKKRRWLLIGDSVHRDYRSHFQNLCRGLQVSIDFYASSFHIEEKAFKREIEHFLDYNEYEHEIIFVGWGTHHGFARHTRDNDDIKASYRKCYKELLEYVMDRCRQVVVLAGTPVMTQGNLKEFDPNVNPEVIERNIIAQEIAREYNVPFVDHYKFVLEHREEVQHRDRKHFVQPKSYQLLVQDLYDSLFQNGILNADGQLSDKVREKNVVGIPLEESCFRPNLMWLEQYRLIASDADWLKKKALLGNSNSEIGYAYLYVLLRLLEEHHPKNILEFNFGQATKIVAQYAAGNSAKHMVLEHDRNRVEHFVRCWNINWTGTIIQCSQLMKAQGKGVSGWWYGNFSQVTQGQAYNLILLKCPFGGGNCPKSHMEILTGLPDILADDFAILMDHVEDANVMKVFQEIRKNLKSKGIAYICRMFSSPGRRVGLLVSEKMRYVEEY